MVLIELELGSIEESTSSRVGGRVYDRGGEVGGEEE